MSIRWTKKDRKTGEETTYTTHEGLVLDGFITRVDRVMSDIYADQYYARVWDPEAGQVRDLLIGSSFELFCGPYGDAEADATPETLAAFKALKEAREKAAREAREERERKAAEAEAKKPGKGRWVRVARGRKYPKGWKASAFGSGTGAGARGPGYR